MERARWNVGGSLFALIAALVAGCGGGGSEGGAPAPGDDPAAAGPTYYKDVYPIIQTRCVSCHVEGGIGSFALEDPAVVVSMAGSIHAVTESGAMPPWPPTELSPALRDARALTPAELDTIARWTEAGAPLGDPAEQPAGIEPAAWPLTSPDLVVDMGVDYSPDPSLTDDYRCFVADLGLAEARKMVGFRALPGNEKIAHHLVTTLYQKSDLPALQALDAETAEPGWPCFGGAIPDGAGVLPVGSLGSWTPGNLGRLTYPGTAVNVPADTVVVMQMHYNTANGFDPDRTAMELYFAPPEDEAELLPLRGVGAATRDILIPANSASTTITVETAVPDQLGSEVYAVGAGAHGHYLLRHHRMTLNKGTAEERILLDLEWDFHWQGQYVFESPIALRAGDTVTLDCTYDNSPEYRMSVGLPAVSEDVTWGEGTTDEMCMGSLQVVTALPAQ